MSLLSFHTAKPLAAQRLFRLFLGKIQMPEMKSKNAGTVWRASKFPPILQDKVNGEVKRMFHPYCMESHLSKIPEPRKSKSPGEIKFTDRKPILKGKKPAATITTTGRMITGEKSPKQTKLNEKTHSQLLKPAFSFSQAQTVKLVDPDTLHRSSLFFS